MAAPKYEVVQKRFQNPQASAPLFIPILVLCNTSEDDLARNINYNSARDLKWLAAKPAHDGLAVMVGGGPSLADSLGEVRRLQQRGATVFAINGASRWLRARGVAVDYQVIADAKEETATLVDPEAKAHLFSSQVSPVTMDAVADPIVWHPALDDVENYFPAERVTRGGYVLLGGGHTGNAALCIAYALGFRDLHVFGYDSSHKAGRSHAYSQPMNDFVPTVDVDFAGRTFTCSVAMKSQAEKFQLTAQALKEAGARIEVYGDGLLQHIYTAPRDRLTERDKYRTIWQFDTYREVSPGELTVGAFLELSKAQRAPGDVVIDFGCGTGRAGLALAKADCGVLLVDFADNCRDDEALALPFMEWDLTESCPARAPFGVCIDVMEHIPPNDTEAVLANIMASAERVFFSIDREPDALGTLIGESLHINLRTHDAWLALLRAAGAGGCEIEFEQSVDGHSLFYVRSRLRSESQEK